MTKLLLVFFLAGCATTGNLPMERQTVLIHVEGGVGSVSIHLDGFRLVTITHITSRCVSLPYPGTYSLLVHGSGYDVRTVPFNTENTPHWEWTISTSRINTQLRIRPALPQVSCKE